MEPIKRSPDGTQRKNKASGGQIGQETPFACVEVYIIHLIGPIFYFIHLLE